MYLGYKTEVAMTYAISARRAAYTSDSLKYLPMTALNAGPMT